MSDITNAGGLSVGTLLQLEQMAEHGVTVEIERVGPKLWEEEKIHQVLVTVTQDDEEVETTRILSSGLSFPSMLESAIDIAYMFTMGR